MISVYYSKIDEKRHENLLQEYLPDFPDHFRIKISRYQRWQDAQLSLLGRILLKRGMRETPYAGDNLIMGYSTNYKKPFLEDEQIKFNISHSGEIVVCAITTLDEIGIDVEEIRTIDAELYKQQMTEYEWAKISGSKNRLLAFYSYWTQKEAVMKANGKGFSIPPNSFDIVNYQSVLDSELYSLTEIIISENYKCHLAIKGDFGSLRPLQKLYINA